MSRQLTANKQKNAKKTQLAWKTRRSELAGYKKMYYANTESGDYLRADLGSEDGTVRLYLELESDGGAGYISIIKNGKVNVEKSTLSRKMGDFSDKFTAKADLFSTLPDSSILNTIAGNYGIKQKKSAAETFKETRIRYFKEKNVDNPDGILRRSRSESVRTKVTFIDVIDFVIGLAIAAVAFWAFNYDFVILGIVLAVFGLIVGTIDVFIRMKELVVAKMLFFILMGILSYVYGYFLA